jgi:hypothetical protein
MTRAAGNLTAHSFRVQVATLRSHKYTDVL